MAFKGIIPALLTPYDDGGAVNLKAIAPLVDRLVADGVAGLFVCGSTGEYWLLSEAERMAIVDTVVACVNGRVKVMVHIGAEATAASMRLARHAETAGADAISALPPTGRPYPAECIWSHFKAIGASCRLPLYLYHLPQVHGELISVDKFVEAIDEIPTLAGAKFSSYRIDDLINLRIKAQGRLNIISGCGEQLLSAMACGADGSICTWYNFFPRLGNRIIDCVNRGDIAEARRLEEIIVAFGMACIKKHLAFLKRLIKQRGIDCGTPRLPQSQLSEAEFAATLPAIEATGVMDWCI